MTAADFWVYETLAERRTHSNSHRVRELRTMTAKSGKKLVPTWCSWRKAAGGHQILITAAAFSQTKFLTSMPYVKCSMHDVM